jgi:hypothetical protein
VGLEPEQGIYRQLKGNLANLYLVGDAREAKNIIETRVWDAYEVARMYLTHLPKSPFRF